MLDEIQHTVDQHDGLQHLLQLDRPDLTIAHVKSSLGMARDIDKNIEDATEAYNIAVCQTLGEAMQRHGLRAFDRRKGETHGRLWAQRDLRNTL
jgi:hypothetical protein